MAKTTQQAEKPAWLKITEAEMKKIISELAEKHQPAKVGIILRDQYGIPTTKVYGKKLGAYLKELGFNSNPDLNNVEKKLERLQEHFKNNITDRKSKHKLQKARGKVTALQRYSKKRQK